MAGLVAALVFALSCWIGLLLTEPLPDSLAWLGVGLTRSLAPALALPWVLVPLVQVRREAAQPRGDESKSSR
jgi:cell shape-determining protein MreD